MAGLKLNKVLALLALGILVLFSNVAGVNAACEKHAFAPSDPNYFIQYYFYSSGRTYTFTAQNSMDLTTVTTKQKLAGPGTYSATITVSVNGNTLATWVQSLTTVYTTYTLTENVSYALKKGDTIQYRIAGGTSTTAGGAITDADNYVQLCGGPNDDPDAYVYYMPVFKPQPDHWSGVGITNLNKMAQANVRVITYRQNGDTQSTDTKIIPAGGQDSFLVGAGLTSDGWIKVTSDQMLAGLNFLGRYETGETNSYLADVAFSDTPSTLLVIPHCAHNDNWDTFAYIANPNGSSASVTLTYTSKTGASCIPYGITIPANGSKEISVGTIASSTSVKGGYVTISSTQSVVAFALYQNLKTGNYSYTGINAVDISGTAAAGNINMTTGDPFDYKTAGGFLNFRMDEESGWDYDQYTPPEGED